MIPPRELFTPGWHHRIWRRWRGESSPIGMRAAPARRRAIHYRAALRPGDAKTLTRSQSRLDRLQLALECFHLCGLGPEAGDFAWRMHAAGMNDGDGAGVAPLGQHAEGR